eukprot:8712105-Pyramimonas_sp.AAC.1
MFPREVESERSRVRLACGDASSDGGRVRGQKTPGPNQPIRRKVRIPSTSLTMQITRRIRRCMVSSFVTCSSISMPGSWALLVL